ncbi:hypothetical protein UNDYM_0574 [Undibacterium sp. YM2]|uniref:hypothetical protein n=1 Tax=Undibacterium sp. YM2 TaxID=2058625 RepID=UPI001331C4E1|nr:hypothetical protein [Undibacterium sp. YM2]BBB64827.1 hypothetical protein UNDYM_0574 [Undibacterium sp. YM2]
MPSVSVFTPARYVATLVLTLLMMSAHSSQAQTQASLPASTPASAPASTPASSSASAAEAAAQELQSVEVKAVRDPAIMPYKMAYELMSKVRAASKDKVQIQIRITSAKTRAPVPNLSIYLDGKNTHQQLDISATGFVNVPLDQAAYADGAEFVTNQKKGSMEVHVLLLPKLPQDVFKYADISESIEAAQMAIKELVPWYFRLFMPSVNSIGICYAGQNQTVLVKGSEEQQLPANSDTTDPLKNKVHCARFAAKDVAKEKGNLIMPATGWQAIYM